MISETRESLLAVERELDAIYNHVRRGLSGLGARCEPLPDRLNCHQRMVRAIGP
jgi:hypothetical protein